MQSMRPRVVPNTGQFGTLLFLSVSDLLSQPCDPVYSISTTAVEKNLKKYMGMTHSIDKLIILTYRLQMSFSYNFKFRSNIKIRNRIDKLTWLQPLVWQEARQFSWSRSLRQNLQGLNSICGSINKYYVTNAPQIYYVGIMYLEPT